MPEQSPLSFNPDWQLAQINVGHALAPLDDPRMAGFTGELDALNALAERSPGFIWRLQDDSGNATSILAGSDPLLLVNMSVWQSVDSLEGYVYSGPHLASLKQRRQWFRKAEWPSLALWWIPAGHTPSVSEGMSKLELLRQQGPNPQAFSFASRWPEPESATSTP
ncbi:DUF3291 domain-containing protein [Chitinilyticum piscinae]|uniref:DUF3291 domain-containing protein n=1 Tax=Chitinilyticum piscinae TaxID=2866724 RepID=A0A8J7K7F9_9NEIS|nr:DUF3291 domain-containing protein [Chitinilyticum piscinae]MBE9607993.1 DUF3291 domain-containing protein [Chitinilyticum piscinae]